MERASSSTERRKCAKCGLTLAAKDERCVLCGYDSLSQEGGGAQTGGEFLSRLAKGYRFLTIVLALPFALAMALTQPGVYFQLLAVMVIGLALTEVTLLGYGVVREWLIGRWRKWKSGSV